MGGNPQYREEREGVTKGSRQSGNACKKRMQKGGDQKGNTDGMGKRRRCIDPSRGEGDARGAGSSHSG